MDRRHAMMAMGLGGLAATAGGAEPARTLKVSIVLPGLYGLDGKLTMPPTLRKAGFGLRFVVVVENISNEDIYVWAEGNSAGHGTLSFEFTEADGKKTVVRRIEHPWSKNILRAEKLAPRGLHARVVEYDPLPGKAAGWEPFPFREKNYEASLRAVFEQPEQKNEKLKLWSGKIVSETVTVSLWNS